MTLQTRPITPKLGVEILGLTGADLCDPAVGAECDALLERHGVLLFRGIGATEDQQVAFTRWFGEVIVPMRGGMDSHPEISPISRNPERDRIASYRPSTFFWHLDGMNDLIPQKATILSAKEISADGDATEFANLYAAYDALPPDQRSEADRHRVIHSFARSQRLSYPDPTPQQVADWDRIPVQVHPLVWTRPDGRKSLLVGATAAKVIGVSGEESREILERMLEWSTRPEFVVTHHWEVGDLVVFDNTGVMHRALPYDESSPRLLHRTTLAGEYAVA